MCLRPERTKMPVSSPQVAGTPGELELLISFQTGGDAGLSLHPFPHTTTYFVHEFYLPLCFCHEWFLKSHWRRSEPGPQWWCQEWNRRSGQRQGSDLQLQPGNRCLPHGEGFCGVSWQPSATGREAWGHLLTQEIYLPKCNIFSKSNGERGLLFWLSCLRWRLCFLIRLKLYDSGWTHRDGGHFEFTVYAHRYPAKLSYIVSSG